MRQVLASSYDDENVHLNTKRNAISHVSHFILLYPNKLYTSHSIVESALLIQFHHQQRAGGKKRLPLNANFNVF